MILSKKIGCKFQNVLSHLDLQIGQPIKAVINGEKPTNFKNAEVQSYESLMRSI